MGLPAGRRCHSGGLLVQSCDRRAPDDIVVRAVAGHMHLLGRSIRVELAPGRPTARTLLDRPRWDSTTSARRRWRNRCGWGEGTSDEMCLGIVLYTRR